MFDQRLWKTHIHQREQQFTQEAENDRRASEYRDAHVTHNPLAVALRDALAIIRARITAAPARANAKPVAAKSPTAKRQAVSILAQAEEVVRLRWTKAPNTPSDCSCDAC